MPPRRQRVLITGASSGLGLGMAREHAARGRDVALLARRIDRLETLAAELRAAHPSIRVVTRALDVDDHAEVPRAFDECAVSLGGLDRVVVNAGIGLGGRIGTGHAEDNLRTARTNFVSALAQCEAAVAIFRRQQQGHLVVISSVSASRGLPRHLTAYAASKAGVSALAEGIRAELMGTGIAVSTMLPGYIRTELNAGAAHLPFEVDLATGARLLVSAIEREPATAYVPAWPWTAIAFLMRHLPLRFVKRMA